jgi:hypothetical protein
MQPRVVAISERYELVGTLTDSELSMLIDDAPTNAPVLGATLVVEIAGRQYPAPFHADHGDYAVADNAALDALRREGGALVFVIDADGTPDLLTGELDAPLAGDTTHADADHDAGHSDNRRVFVYAAAGAAALGALAVWLARRRKGGAA